MWWQASKADPLKLGGSAKSSALAEGEDWSTELLQLAARQRMNTDVRRTVFCIIMGSEDYMDASERLLRLPLKVQGFPSGGRHSVEGASLSMTPL